MQVFASKATRSALGASGFFFLFLPVGEERNIRASPIQRWIKTICHTKQAANERGPSGDGSQDRITARQVLGMFPALVRRASKTGSGDGQGNNDECWLHYRDRRSTTLEAGVGRGVNERRRRPTGTVDWNKSGSETRGEENGEARAFLLLPSQKNAPPQPRGGRIPVLPTEPNRQLYLVRIHNL